MKHTYLTKKSLVWCSRCHGTGRGPNKSTCPNCNGDRVVNHTKVEKAPPKGL